MDAGSKCFQQKFLLLPRKFTEIEAYSKDELISVTLQLDPVLI